MKSQRASSTALHHAAHQDHVEVVKVLIAHGANVEAVTADDNATPLYFAALGDSERMLSPCPTFG